MVTVSDLASDLAKRGYGLAGRRATDVISVSRDRLQEELVRRRVLTNYVHVAEFPKSGGTWLTGMLRSASVADGSVRRRFVQHHWAPDSAFRPTIYVVRDGRDVVISLYHHNVRHLRLNTMWSRRVDRFFSSTFGPRYDSEDVRGNLPAFIDQLSTNPFGAMLRPRRRGDFDPWPVHVEKWSEFHPTLLVRYEDALADPYRELARMASTLDIRCPTDDLAGIVAAHSFRQKTGREPGAEDRSSFYRRGVAGEWREVYSQAAKAAFSRFAGQTLIDLGYESDASWVNR